MIYYYFSHTLKGLPNVIIKAVANSERVKGYNPSPKIAAKHSSNIINIKYICMYK